MARSVGLQIHSRGLRAVELNGSAKSYRVSRYFQRELTPRGGAPDPEELYDALQDLFKAGFEKTNVILSAPAGDMVVREIPIPFKTDDQIRKVIKYEAEHHLHDCDADDVVVQYTKVGETAEGTNLLVFAARKTEVGQRIENLRAAGVEPLAVELDALALYNAVQAAGMADDAPDCMLMDIGHRSTELVVLQGGEVRALRSVRLGTETIAQGLARDMDIDPSEADSRMEQLGSGEPADMEGDFLIPADAEEGKRETEKSHAELEQDLFRQREEELLSRLKREFVRTSGGIRGGRPATRVIVSGVGQQLPGFVEALQARLGVPVEAFDPSEHYRHKLNGDVAGRFQAQSAVPLGLALKGLGVDPLRVDFRQEDLKVANKFDLLKMRLAVTVTIAFVALLAASFYFYLKKQSYIGRDGPWTKIQTNAYKDFKAVVAEGKTPYNRVNPFLRGGKPEVVDPGTIEAAGPGYDVLKRYVSKLRSLDTRLRRRIGGGTAEPVKSSLHLWNQIFKTVKENHKAIGYLDVQGLSITQEVVRISVVVESATAGDLLGRALQKIPELANHELLNPSYQSIRNSSYKTTRYEFRKRKKKRGRR